jgi:Putative Actinobacterial Holin-X, holin superfamily III
MTTPLGERSLGELVATLTRDLALLVHQEIELIKADLVAALKRVARGAAGLAIAAVLALFALPIVSIAIALGIHALGISLGWSFLIVAGGYLFLGAIAALVGIRMLRRAKPSNRAVISVKADLQAIARKPGSKK